LITNVDLFHMCSTTGRRWRCWQHDEPGSA